MALKIVLWNDSTKEIVQTGLEVRQGNQTIGSGVATLSVTFATAMPNSTYALQVAMKNVTDSTPQFQPLTITAQSTTGFTVKWNANTDTANYSINYIAIG